MRILAVDPGEKSLGIALSDPTGTIANPLVVLQHVSRPVDAAAIASLAAEHGAEMIIVGHTLDEDGNPTPQGRRARRLSAAIRTQSSVPVVLWDESGSTQAARQARLDLRVSRRRRSGHLDDLAATYILQSFLDSGARGTL
jgi:putative Holliday junction resolvase